MSAFEMLAEYFSHSFVINALIVGVLTSLCASLFGVTLVLKRMSFIGDGLSHVAFGALAIAPVLNVTQNLFIVLPVTVLCAVLLLRAGQNAKIKGDAAIAMLSVSALAMGYLLLSVSSSSSNFFGDVCTTLFGSASVITLGRSQVMLCLILSVAVLVVFVLFYNRLFAVTFDEDFAKAGGLNSSAYNMLIAIVIAVVIVLAMSLVGSLLISALVIFPAISAMRVFGSFRGVTVCAAAISVFCAATGFVISMLATTPVGATIVAVNCIVFLLCCILGKIRRGC